MHTTLDRKEFISAAAVWLVLKMGSFPLVQLHSVIYCVSVFLDKNLTAYWFNGTFNLHWQNAGTTNYFNLLFPFIPIRQTSGCLLFGNVCLDFLLKKLYFNFISNSISLNRSTQGCIICLCNIQVYCEIEDQCFSYVNLPLHKEQWIPKYCGHKQSTYPG